jgi:uncharacterized membrane protein
MKKKAIVVASVLALILLLVGVGKANPYWWYQKVPPDEHTKPPIISVLSPANNTVFREGNVSLSFEVYLGESKTALDTLLLTVDYEPSWQDISNGRFAPWSAPNPFVHEVNLTGIPEGTHSIVIHATEKGVYNNATAFTIDTSATIYFTVNTSPEATIPEFPTWTILPILATVTLLIIVCKHRLTKQQRILGD